MPAILVTKEDSFEVWRSKTNQISQSIENVTAINSSIAAVNDTVTISTVSTERLRVDSLGNIGESSVPSAWAVSNKAFQMPAGSMYSLSGTTQGVSQNAYLSGTGWKYVVTGYASRYEQFNGTHTWYSAVSGTADANTSFSQKMTLNANGNVGIGATPDSWGTPFSGVIQGQNGTFFASRAATSDLSIGTNMYYNGTAWVYKTSDFASYYRQAGGTHYWFTAASGTAGATATLNEVMRLDSSGNLMIGATTAASKATIKQPSTASGLTVEASADASRLHTFSNGSNWIFDATVGGTGSYQPITFRTSGNERVRIDASGNLGIGTTSLSAKLHVQDSTTVQGLCKNTGTTGQASWTVTNDSSKSGVLGIYASTQTAFGAISSGDAFVYSSANNLVLSTDTSGAAIKFATGTSNAERMRIDSSGNVLVTAGGGLGYGTGSGGTVTQATSKDYLVSLDKPSGQITMNNAALASNEIVTFTLNSNKIADGDVVTVNPKFGVAGINYQAWCYHTFTGGCYIAVRNISAGTLSEAVVLSFVVTKASTT